MTKNSIFFMLLILGVMPMTMMAQDDDMYFVPSKSSRPAPTYTSSRSVYYSGSHRSVDEYNRRGGSYYQVLPTDSAGNDIIDFIGGKGVYPDSTSVEDFALTRQMTRYDGYEPSSSYWSGYYDGRRDSWGWHSPWFYSSYYPWYDSYWYWHDPWYYGYYGWYGGWYSPWHYSYYWNRPYGWYGSYTYYSSGPGYVHRSGSHMTSNLRYYDRRNYTSSGVRNNRASAGYRTGNSGSGLRPSSSRRASVSASNTRVANSGSGTRSTYTPSVGSYSSGFSGSGVRSVGSSSGSIGGGGGGFRSSGGGGGGGARSVGGGHGGGGRR